MNYEGQICRAPMERASFMLPVMVGCTYNRCKFCDLFKHLTYRELPLKQIEEELKRVQSAGGDPGKVFLGDGNAFSLSPDRLQEILEMLHSYFPSCEAVNMDATVTSILSKSQEDLDRLYKAGVRHLYIGIESGLDDVLTFMEKDHGLGEAYEAIRRLKKAGLIYDAHIMTGVAGHGRGRENAEALAEFFNRTQPRHIVNFSLFLHKDVSLYEEIKNGRFVPADELENLQEERRLLELLEEAQEIRYDGLHDFLEIRVRGILPREKEKMLEKLDRAIAEEKGKGIEAWVEGMPVP